MVAQQTIALEEVVRPEYVTYKQAAAIVGVKYDTVRVYQTRSRALEKKGNPAGVPLFPMPMRIDGFKSAVVFRRADIEAYVQAQQNRPNVPGRPADNVADRLDWDQSKTVTTKLKKALAKKKGADKISIAEISRQLGIAPSPVRARMNGEARWRKEEVATLETLLGTTLL